jgi:predicted Rossmann fold flavoprotein
MKNETIIIGGGASALMAAALLPKNSATIIEHNAHLGAKMLISGGGKCNITNEVMGAEYFLADEVFVTPALRAFDQHALIAWLKNRGLKVEIRKGSQYFCQHSAKDIVALLQREAQKQKIRLNEEVQSVRKRGEYFTVTTEKGEYSAKRVIVASGGLSFPRLGASDIGYRIATAFGHTIIRTAPALVGMTVQKEQFFFKELSGASTDVDITVGEHHSSGALLFAHKGISGPAVLDASLYWEKGMIEIDFLPGFSLDRFKGSKKHISTLLPLPKRITKAFLLQLGIQDKPFVQVTTEEYRALQTLHQYRFAPAGTFGYSKAEVTKGGIDTAEVDPLSMMSKHIEGLYFTGEVLDVTGRLGGYNFQWAFSSAYSCTRHIKGER